MADISTVKLVPLNQNELTFVDSKVNNAFLHKFGSTQGFGMFCSVSKQQGFKCSSGPQAKASYATYLKNAKVSGGNLFVQMTTAYNSLDGFTKAAMAKKIIKGKTLQSKTFNTGCFTKFTKGELVEIAELAQVSVSGNKANICSQLQASGVDLSGLWAGSNNITINPQSKQTGTAAWQQYARSTNKRGAATKQYGSVSDPTNFNAFAASVQEGGLTKNEIAFYTKLAQK